ncbi:MAG: SRPBCC family protein [Ilumatobacteraceae bacterium]
MKVDVSTTIVIERPIAEVSAFAGDPSNAPTWYRRIDQADWVTEPPISLGSRIDFRARFLGRQLEYTYEVTEYTPGEQVSMRTTDGSFPMATTYRWRPVGDRATHMVLHNWGEPAGFSRLVAPLIGRMMRRAMNQDLGDLKHLLESRS